MVYCDILSVVAKGLTMRFDDFRNSSLRQIVGSHYDKLSVMENNSLRHILQKCRKIPQTAIDIIIVLCYHVNKGEKKMNKNENVAYPLKLNADYYVVTANDLIKGKQKMSLREAQLLYITMAQIVKDDTDFKTYKTSVPALADFMGISADSLYRDLESICTNLLQRVVKVQINDADGKDRKWKAFQWISYAEYRNSELIVRLNDEIKPFLIDLMSHYSQILLGTLCAFKSYYTARLYQLIVCEIGEHPRVGKEEWSFTCDELREFFQIEKNTYVRTSDLIRRTIRPALNELQESDFAYIWDYEEIRERAKGCPLSGVKFKAMVFKNREEKDIFLKNKPRIDIIVDEIADSKTSKRKK